jgi:hypothetical protein
VEPSVAVARRAGGERHDHFAVKHDVNRAPRIVGRRTRVKRRYVDGILGSVTLSAIRFAHFVTHDAGSLSARSVP